MISVAADKYLYNLQSYLSPEINIKLYNPEDGLPADLSPFDALLIRTVTDINRKTLPTIPPKLQFIGTASAGSDHVDINYLCEKEIAFSDAAGCNARAVAEYVAVVLLLWTEKNNIKHEELRIGIVGAGHVGSELMHLLDSLNIPYAAYDPPRAEREKSFVSATLEELLSCDVLTFHTPLTRSGPHATYHLMNEEKFRGRQFSLLINTSRGGVVDEQALLKAYDSEIVKDFIIDVWENEPVINRKVAEKCFIATPHIAGYSIQAKENATRLVIEDMLNHFNLQGIQVDVGAEQHVLQKSADEFRSLPDLLTDLHPVRQYEKALRDILLNYPGERGIRFNRLRAQYPLRQQFNHIHTPESYFRRFPILRALGFSTGSGKTE